jgi:hypothetical protein
MDTDDDIMRGWVRACVGDMCDVREEEGERGGKAKTTGGACPDFDMMRKTRTSTVRKRRRRRE